MGRGTTRFVARRSASDGWVSHGFLRVEGVVEGVVEAVVAGVMSAEITNRATFREDRCRSSRSSH